MEPTTYYQNKLKVLERTVDGFAQVMQVDLESMGEFEQDVYKSAAV